MMKFDTFIETYLGDFGWYQKRQYLLLCLPAISGAMQMLSPVFILNIPPHRCSLPGTTNDTYADQGPKHEFLLNTTIPWEKIKDEYERSSCRLYSDDDSGLLQGENRTTYECDSWVYDKSVFQSTMITKLDMVCPHKDLRAHANSILMAGLLVGSLLLGIVSDIFGRKPTLMLAIILHCGSSIGTAFAPNYIAFVILRFLNGASNIGLFMSAFVLGIELVGPSKRTLAGMVIELFWCLGLFILAAAAYGLREWNHLQLAISIPPVLLLSFFWLIPESPRWLLSRGRQKEAEVILRKAAEVNKVELPLKLFGEDGLQDETQEGRIKDMFTSPTILIRTLIIFFNWLVVSMVYYGLGLNVGNLHGDIYLNYTLSSVVETVSYVLCIFLLDRVGRKILHCGSMLLGGIACLATIFPVLYGTSDHDWITMALSLIGKLGASAAFAIIYVFSAELFPTVLRNSGMGGSSFSARIGGVLSPYVADLGTFVGGDFGSALPLIIFGATTILAGLLSLHLPETLHRKLPETVEDAINFKRSGGKNSYELEQFPSTDKDGKPSPDSFRHDTKF